MKIEAAPYGKTDLRTACGKLKLWATHGDEATWMAALYMTVVHGGRLTIESAGGEDLSTVGD